MLSGWYGTGVEGGRWGGGGYCPGLDWKLLLSGIQVSFPSMLVAGVASATSFVFLFASLDLLGLLVCVCVHIFCICCFPRWLCCLVFSAHALDMRGMIRYGHV